MTTAPVPVHRRPAPWIAALVFALVVIAVVAIVLLIRHDGSQSSSVSSGTEGSGVAAVEPRHVASFTGVELAGSNAVTVHVGRKQSVAVRGDDNLLRRVTTRVSGGSLVIDNEGGFTTRSRMSVEVTVPSLDTLVLSGSGRVIADGIRARQLKVTLSGSGMLHASGTATHLDVSLDGSGDIQLGGLPARDVRAVLVSSGRIVVNATRSLDASVQGSGAIVYLGDPTHVTRSVTGSGAIASE